jgi:alanine-synthesizing transaminase
MRRCSGRCPPGSKAARRFSGRFGRGAANLAELDRQLARLPEVSRLEAEGGWYAVLRIPALQPDEQTVLELLERGVWVHPGYFFGMAESGWLVVSLLGPEAEFSRGVAGLSLLGLFQGRQTPPEALFQDN